MDLMPLVYSQFLETGPELGNNYTEVIAPQDVATYGGLCALASFDRTELKASIKCFFILIVIFKWFHNCFLTECFHLAE